MAGNLIYKIIESIPSFRKRYHKISHDISGYLYHFLNREEIKQNDFAKRMKKSESEISKWLSGYHNFTIKTIAKIESELGIEIIKVPFYERENDINKTDFRYSTNSNASLEMPNRGYLTLLSSNNLFNETPENETDMLFKEDEYPKAVNS